MLKLREFLERTNGHGLKITSWEKLDSYLEKELSAFLGHSVVANVGEIGKAAQEGDAEKAPGCICNAYQLENFGCKCGAGKLSDKS